MKRHTSTIAACALLALSACGTSAPGAFQTGGEQVAPASSQAIVAQQEALAAHGHSLPAPDAAPGPAYRVSVSSFGDSLGDSASGLERIALPLALIALILVLV